MHSATLQHRINSLAISIIESQQAYLAQLGYQAHIHFELEGCFAGEQAHVVDLATINQWLARRRIAGKLVSEYWQNQWEYISHFNGQTPLQEAHNLFFVMNNLANIVAKQGDIITLIKPVVWAGDKGKLAAGCQNVFTDDTRAVHIPNAIQLNVSLTHQASHTNMLAEGDFAIQLQNSFLQTSLGCCLLYLPEEEAFERFALKTKYGLAAELCSPIDISGGYQGSIALYRQLGKHNQKMGEKALIYDQYQQPLINEYHWHKTTRIEHRLGAASKDYNPYINVVFALANIIFTLENRNNNLLLANFSAKLPSSLYDDQDMGAISLFAQDHWFAQQIDAFMMKMSLNNNQKNTAMLPFLAAQGSQLKQLILAQYQQTYTPIT